AGPKPPGPVREPQARAARRGGTRAKRPQAPRVEHHQGGSAAVLDPSSTGNGAGNITFRLDPMVATRIDLLDPWDVARLGGIEIVAQGVVEGFLAGIHRSPFRGFSVEFTEHRAYQPGDELRYLDWKILDRADRLFVKQFEQEDNLRKIIRVDASRSMAWRGAPNRLTKRAYADRIAAALALILLRQRDATG